MKVLSTSILLAALLALPVLPAPTASGCATVMGKGERVAIASESALIVWDDKTKTQHFIRRASFQTRVPYFGFLVPTPTRPELAEVSDEVFSNLEEWTKPEVHKSVVYWTPFTMSATFSAAKESDVEVLQQGRVSGFDYAVLKATDGKALRGWLDEHGYDARPQFTAWVEPYIKQGWIITAFQIAKTDKQEDRLSTKAVRMSFKADRPFFPYREPAEAEKTSVYWQRLLRIFLIADRRMQGALDGGKTPWRGQAVWANPLTSEQQEALAEQLGGCTVGLPEEAWLTVFDDGSSPRPGHADLVFAPSEDQSTLKRRPIFKTEMIYWPAQTVIVIVFAVPLVLLGLVVSRLVIRWRERRGAIG
jgi:hypothetical protein